MDILMYELAITKFSQKFVGKIWNKFTQ